MLRQALDAAQEGEQEQQASSVIAPSESTSFGGQGDGGSTTEYGATTETEEENSLLHSYGEEGDYSWQEEEDEEEEESSFQSSSCLEKAWDKAKNAFLVVANVENLWDTPPDQMRTNSQQRQRSNLIVLFWFVVLASSYASERSTFKLCVDRAGPFRLFAVEMVTASHAIMLGTGILVKRLTKQSSRIRSLGIPVVDVGFMALLDTITLLLVFLSGLHVPPTLTVILVQFTLPLTAFLTQFVHPDGRCTFCRQTPETTDDDDDEEQRIFDNNDREEVEIVQAVEGTPLPGWGGLSAEHVWGSLIIFLAVLLALLPAFYAIAEPDFFNYADTIPIRTALNTLLFVSSCIPSAASQLYKEHIFLQYKQPVNMGYLNLLLSIFQFVFATIMAPLVFSLQGLGARGNWFKLYPSSQFSENFIDGLRCFFGLLPEDDQAGKYPEEARCGPTLGLALIHSFSIIAVGVAVDKIVKAGATKVMYRGISAGIILAVLGMRFYDLHIPDFNYGPAIDGLQLVCVILLILGSEVYHRVSLQGSTFETVYPEVERFYDEE